MRLIKIGVASVNATVGKVRSNTDQCIALAHQMAAADVTMAVFPEQVIGGYAPEDLVQWRAFIDAQRRELHRFCNETKSLDTVMAIGLTVGVGGDLFNAACMVHKGKILGFCPKEKLPTYNVFYEARVFSRGAHGLLLDAEGVPCGDQIFRFDFGVVALEVCEDIWSPDGPMRRRCYSGAELVCNLSASPYRASVQATRREMIATRAADNQTVIAYANLLGANDGLVFDGGGFIYQNGRPLLEAPRFQEGFASAVVDLDRTLRSRREASTWRVDCEQFRREHRAVAEVAVHEKTANRSKLQYPAPPNRSFFLPGNETPQTSPRSTFLDELFEVLAWGVADYYRKIGAFKSIGVAVSGGRDSLLTLLVAWRAISIMHPGLNADALRAKCRELLAVFTMPTTFSSEETKGAAMQIAQDLGIELTTVPIQDAFERESAAAVAMLEHAPTQALTPLTVQNIQARIRGTRMWNWANTSGGLFLQTGNMSEKALGYTTVGGDLEGAFSVIANVPKTVVIALIERLYERYQLEGIRLTLETMPGPELAPNQSGEAELMPYEILDACLYLYGAEKLSADEVAMALTSIFPEHDAASLRGFSLKFAKMFTQSIYKWVQAPLAIHVGSLDLDRERALQLPVVQGSEW